MPVYPVRHMGSAGIVTDVYPYDLDSSGAFSAGVNVRFKNGRISRAPVARTVAQLPFEPGHVLSIPPGAAGFDEIVMVAQDFSTLQSLNGSSFVDMTPPGHVGAAGTQAITSCFLGGVSYVNRETHAPIYRRPADSTYSPIPGWTAGDRCRVLRAYKDQLIALGVTKAGEFYPTMVKWSDITGFGQPPQSWDTSDPERSAGENIVNEMQHQIVDGMTLRDTFIVYCSGSVWSMDYTGGQEIYVFRKLLDEVGVIAPNCVVQVGGMHYVFDRNDIYTHDGVNPRSIADGKVKEFIFGSLDFAKADRCFVQHDARLTEIRFCYPSHDDLTGFQNPSTGCNRAAVYNYSSGTWTFYDLPNVVGCTKAAIQSGKSWDGDPVVTFDNVGGLFMTSEGDEDRHCLFVGRSDPSQGLTAPRLYGFDLINGGRLSAPVEPETLRPARVERVGIDLDEHGKNLRAYMNLQAIWPQMRADHPLDCYWQFGASDLANSEPSWGLPTTFDPATETKIDINDAGKYLAYRFVCGGQGDFQLSGIDVELLTRGRR